VPKVELCGAELLSIFIAEMSGTKVLEGRAYCWCDSVVAFLWIRDDSSIFNIFAANCVAAIQELTESVTFQRL